MIFQPPKKVDGWSQGLGQLGFELASAKTSASVSAWSHGASSSVMHLMLSAIRLPRRILQPASPLKSLFLHRTWKEGPSYLNPAAIRHSSYLKPRRLQLGEEQEPYTRKLHQQ